MRRVLGFLDGHATWMLFGGVFIGLAVPQLAALCRPLLTPAVVCLLVATLLRIDWQAMAALWRRPGVAVLMLIWMLVVAPVVLWAVLFLVPLPPALVTALVLMTAAPPVLSASSFALMLGLDSALALMVVLACTLIAPFTIPPLALALLDLELSVGVETFMIRLALIVAVAFIAATAIRSWAGPARLARNASAIDGLLVVILLVFAVAIMDGVTATLIARPQVVLLWLLAAFLANPALQALGALAFLWLGRRQALSVGLMTGNRNMGLLLAALPASADYDVALFFAVAQIPMYMLPAMALPFCRKLLKNSQ